MHNAQFSSNVDYQTIVSLLVRLRKLIRDGLGDSEAAEELRSSMDRPWYALSDAERTRVDGMSADLSTLEPDSPIAHPEVGGILSRELADAIRSARRIAGFEQILELLRRQPQHISADRAAFMRGWCYEHLNDLEISALFFEHAAQLDQANDLYAVFAND